MFRFGLPAILSSILLSCALGFSTAFAATLFDPNVIPYDPKPAALKECGFSVKVDPTWKMETKTADKKGQTAYTYSFGSDTKLNPRPFDVVLFNPQLHANLTCEVTVDKEGKQRSGERLQKYVKSFFGFLHKSAVEKAAYRNFSEIETVEIAGLDSASIYHAEIPPKEGTEFETGGVVFWIAGTKGDVMVSGFFQLIDPVGGKKRFTKGSALKEKLKTGTVEVELANDVTLVKKVYYGSRTLDQDRTFVMDLLRSIH